MWRQYDQQRLWLLPGRLPVLVQVEDTTKSLVITTRVPTFHEFSSKITFSGARVRFMAPNRSANDSLRVPPL